MQVDLTKEQASVLLKVEKLLRKTEGKGATAAEAQVAAEVAQRMLQKHNLTLAMVGDAEAVLSPGAKREKRQTDRRAMYRYQADLMGSLARNNFCRHLVKETWADTYTNGTPAKNGKIKTKRHLLVGRQVNVDVTVSMYDYLQTAVVDEARASGRDPRTSEGKTFLEGAVARLAERLDERRRQAQDEFRKSPTANGSGTELVCLEDVYGSEEDLNNDELYGYAAGTTAARRRKSQLQTLREEAKKKELIDQGEEPLVATYMSWGYDRDRAISMANPAPETGRPRRVYRGTGWTQQDRERYRKLGSEAYKEGRAAGGRIGIDDQVGKNERRSIG